MNAEKITKVEEVFDVQFEGGGQWEKFDGFRVTTEVQEIYVVIENGQSCCEGWGYVVSEDELSRFVGAELRGIDVTTPALENVTVKLNEHGWDGGNGYDFNAQFVTLATSEGPLQFAVYNAHNGYYGHSVSIRSRDLTLETVL